MAADIDAIMEEAGRYADEVRQRFPVDRAYLFGSYAKGTADEKSDVDICFFLRDYGNMKRIDVGIILLSIASDYKAYFEPLVFETSEIGMNNPFVNEILHTGIEI
ncbi:MAG: nucleotidyltransferase domain-containing protein [Methanomassiliicoccaceae archaeon]|nr:nucleotidyltransferase domain-containing protein [Methanomassiliicoccaceae archaeon]